MNYNPDMTIADKEAERLLLVVPTGDAECPLAVELGYWDLGAERWEGEWRHACELETHEPTAMAGMDPIAWAAVPEIDAYFYDLEGELLRQQRAA